MALCSRCREEKPQSEFTATVTYCKPCRTAYRLERKPLLAARRAADPRKALSLRLWTWYRMTLEDWDALLEKQQGRCAICNVSPTGDRLHVDHDHNCCSGKTSCGRCVRGLLCSSCNRSIGFMKDDPNRLRNAATYIEDHRGH